MWISVYTLFASLLLASVAPTRGEHLVDDLVNSNDTHPIGNRAYSWKDAVVYEHNVQRAAFGAEPLTWSDALYGGTFLWARQCQFRHSVARGQYGENLAWNSAPDYGLEAGMRDWMNEYHLYDYNNPNYSPQTGHFTQIVWRDTQQVACALVNCRAGTIYSRPSRFLVCRYAAEGNFIGRFAENVGTPAYLPKTDE